MQNSYDTDKVKSGKLNQLYSYLMHQEDGTPRICKTKGMLLYPTISEEYNLEYRYKDHPIEIRTVNLNQHWEGIKERLMAII